MSKVGLCTAAHANVVYYLDIINNVILQPITRFFFFKQSSYLIIYHPTVSPTCSIAYNKLTLSTHLPVHLSPHTTLFFYSHLPIPPLYLFLPTLLPRYTHPLPCVSHPLILLTLS